ncbi:unnamed protein product [Sphagnum troendelagicum]|jgi:hypothetical protein
MASFVHLPPTIPLRLTKPMESFKLRSFNVTTLKPMEQETKEHHANELVNNILEPCQLLLYGVQETHWLSQEATLKVSGYLFLCSGHDDGLDHDKVAFALALRAIASLFNWEACGPCLL